MTQSEPFQANSLSDAGHFRDRRFRLRIARSSSSVSSRTSPLPTRTGLRLQCGGGVCRLKQMRNAAIYLCHEGKLSLGYTRFNFTPRLKLRYG
jgi:hypothetical protein